MNLGTFREPSYNPWLLLALSTLGEGTSSPRRLPAKVFPTPAQPDDLITSHSSPPQCFPPGGMVSTYFRIREEGTQLHRPQEIPDGKISPTPGLQGLWISGPPTFSSGNLPSVCLLSSPVWLSSLGLPSSALLQVLLYINSGISSLFSTLHPSHPQSITSSFSPTPPPMPSLPAQSSELTS